MYKSPDAIFSHLSKFTHSLISEYINILFFSHCCCFCCSHSLSTRSSSASFSFSFVHKTLFFSSLPYCVLFLDFSWCVRRYCFQLAPTCMWAKNENNSRLAVEWWSLFFFLHGFRPCFGVFKFFLVDVVFFLFCLSHSFIPHSPSNHSEKTKEWKWKRGQNEMCMRYLTLTASSRSDKTHFRRNIFCVAIFFLHMYIHLSYMCVDGRKRLCGCISFVGSLYFLLFDSSSFFFSFILGLVWFWCDSIRSSACTIFHSFLSCLYIFISTPVWCVYHGVCFVSYRPLIHFTRCMFTMSFTTYLYCKYITVFEFSRNKTGHKMEWNCSQKAYTHTHTHIAKSNKPCNVVRVTTILKVPFYWLCAK